MASREIGHEIGAEREMRVFTRVFRDYIRNLGERFELTRPVEISVRIDPSNVFAPRAALSNERDHEIVLTRGTYRWAWLCARVVACLEVPLPWPESVPRDVTIPACVPRDARTACEYGAELAKGVPASSEGFVLFVFMNIMAAIMLHELAHVLRGHLLLLSELDEGPSRPDEALAMFDDGKCNGNGLPTADRKDLEHDADRIAGYLMADLVLSPNERYPVWARNNPNENLAWSLTAFALFSCGIAQHHSPSGAYPEAFARFLSVHGGIRRYGTSHKVETALDEQCVMACFEVLAALETELEHIDGFRDLASARGLQARIDELSILQDRAPVVFRSLAPFWFLASNDDAWSSDEGRKDRSDAGLTD